MLLRTPSFTRPKLLAEWDGQYAVIDRVDETTYEPSMPDHPRRRVKRHINLLKSSMPQQLLFCYSRTGGGWPYSLTKGRRGGHSDHQSASVSNGEWVSARTVEQTQKVTWSKPCQDTEIRLETGDTYPIRRPPYRLDPKKLLMMNDEIKKLLEME